MLLLYYPDPAVDERRRPGPGLEDDGVTAAVAAVEDQEIGIRSSEEKPGPAYS